MKTYLIVILSVQASLVLLGIVVAPLSIGQRREPKTAGDASFAVVFGGFFLVNLVLTIMYLINSEPI